MQIAIIMEVDEDESLLAVLGDGFAQLILLSENYFNDTCFNTSFTSLKADEPFFLQRCNAPRSSCTGVGLAANGKEVEESSDDLKQDGLINDDTSLPCCKSDS